MPHITIALIRKRAEHNEGMISTLEEVALHQEELETIDDVLGRTCRQMKILLLQNNIIARMENLHHLKTLEYLNLALNNIRKIEGLERCEFLNKLDLTINFIDVDDLEESVDNLIDRVHLKDLYMMGNPAEQEWGGFKAYVIARLPQLGSLDGTEITRSMRIQAQQQLPALTAELRELAVERANKRVVEEREKGLEAQEKSAKKARKKAKEEAIEKGEPFIEEVGESESDDEEEMTAHTPEVRVEMYRELAEQKAEKDEREKANQPKKRGEQEYDEEQQAAIAKQREREERGEIKQCNEGKWKFGFDEDKKEGFILLDVAIQKHLSSSLIDVDVHPSYVSIVIKSKTLRLSLPAEVVAADAKASRSKTTGHLLVTMKKIDPKENMVGLRAARKEAERKVMAEKEMRGAEKGRLSCRGLGSQMLMDGGVDVIAGAVRLDGLVSRSKGGVGKKAANDIGLVEKKVVKLNLNLDSGGEGWGNEEETTEEEEYDSDDPPPIS